MLGLLYKDFIAIKGKRLCLFLALGTVLFIILRVILNGEATIDIAMAIDDKGEKANFLDLSFFPLVEFLVLTLSVFFANRLSRNVMGFDERNKIKSYISAMPVKKRSYVTSKYIFVGAFVLASFLLFLLIHFVNIRFSYTKVISEMMYKISVPLICIIVFIFALELPFYIFKGVEKAMLLKIAIVMTIGLALMGFIFFGNLEVFRNFNIITIAQWFDRHNITGKLVKTVTPCAACIAYIVSYLFTAARYDKKEDMN